MSVAEAAPRADDGALHAAWRSHGARGATLRELAAYSSGGFEAWAPTREAELPLADEPFVAAWEGYLAEARTHGVWPSLRERLVQFRFPVAAGTSARADYQAAVRRGVAPAAGELRLRAPGALRLWLHPTLAGRIPVLLLPDRGDFEDVVRALTRRNEPEAIPASMGACIVSGYNNWDRVHALRRAWAEARGDDSEAAWLEEFRRIVPRKELYQDRLILLSEGGYSAVPAGAMGQDPERWLELSRLVRLEHECAHYVTRRLFGSMRNSLHDELVADYAGIVAAAGGFRKDWLLRFLGLEAHPDYRAGGRFENYRGDPPLSDAAFSVLRRVVVLAAERLEEAERDGRLPRRTPAEQAATLHAIAGTPLPVLAREGIRVPDACAARA